MSCNGVQQIVEAVAVFRRHREHIVRKLVERRGERFLHLRIDFVRDDRHRLARATQQARQLGIERRKAGAHVHDQQELRCRSNGDLRLAKDFTRNGGFVIRHDSSGVDDFERPALPGGRAIDAVARNARLVGDDRAPRAGQPVKYRGLADVRAADDDYGWKLFSHKWGHNEP